VYLNVLLALILIGCFASLFANGLWSNTLSLINVVTAALLATNYFEPLAGFLERTISPEATYVWDFIAVWLIFGIAMGVLRALTDAVSPTEVRFHPLVDQVGSYLMATWTAWVLVCFATFTLHTAPLARNFLGGAFQPTPQAKMFFGTGPDRLWMAWVHKESLGSLCRLGEIAEFDRDADLILRYGERRDEFDHQLSFLKQKGVVAPAKAP